jgi:sec-independent protein translocase protein TatB
MFDFFSWKLLIVLGVALVVVGPKDLPKVMHAMGRWMGKARAMANEFKRSFDEMARQTELDELRKEVEALKAQNPLADIEKSLNDSIYSDTTPARAAEEELDAPRAGEFMVTDMPVPDAPVADAAPATSNERAAS